MHSPKKVYYNNVFFGILCDQKRELSYLLKSTLSKYNILGVKFSCDQCEFVTRRTGDLNKHKRTVHEGVRFNCMYCTYSASQVRDQYLTELCKFLK